MNLFEHGEHTLSDGRKTDFKIECDVLTWTDWKTLAAGAAAMLPAFSSVEGIPTGGVPFGDALAPYCRPHGVHLIADDVWWSGKTLREYAGDRQNTHAVVIFARTPAPAWVTVLFQMNPRLEAVSQILAP